MKIKSYGARFYGGQCDRIDHGFRILGHEVTDHVSEADLVYANNGWYTQLIDDKRVGNLKPGAKVIMNVLDLAPHNPDFPVLMLRDQLAEADAVTCISTVVQTDIRQRTGYDATIIYNPIKPIYRTDERKYSFRAMFVGRVNDPEKRAGMGAAALSMLGFSGKEVVTVGGEPPHYGGFYWGVASDDVLNDLYNSVDFLVSPTRNAFLGLPILEAAAAGVIPVFARDLDIREEFFPEAVFPEYAGVEPTPQGLALFMACYLNNDEAMAEMKDRLYRHFWTVWGERLSPAGVAAAILRVHEGLVS